MWAPRKWGTLCMRSEGPVCVLHLLPSTALSRGPWTTVPPAKDALKAPHSSLRKPTPIRAPPPLFLVRGVGEALQRPPFMETPSPSALQARVGSHSPLLCPALWGRGRRSLPWGHPLIEHCRAWRLPVALCPVAWEPADKCQEGNCHRDINEGHSPLQGRGDERGSRE